MPYCTKKWGLDDLTFMHNSETHFTKLQCLGSIQMWCVIMKSDPAILFPYNYDG